MIVDTVVVGFGCPRAGTTFLKHCLDGLHDVFTTKLTENTRMHPCQNRTGLLDIADMMSGKRLVLVRIKRHPLEIAESFLATRLPQVNAPGIARNTDRRIVLWIRRESEAVTAQRPLLAERHNLTLIEVRYEDLAKECGRAKFEKQLAKFAGTHEFRERLDGFGRAPVRSGRLSLGVDTVATKAERAYFAETLQATIGREGYV